MTVAGEAARLGRGRAGRVRLRRGAYVGSAHWASLTADERHLVRVEAVAAACTDPVFSHWSAAAIWGLPTIGRPDDRVHLTIAASSGGRSQGDVVRHATSAPPEPEARRGLLVTGVARTVVDLARAGGLACGLVVADAALRAGLVGSEALDDEVRRAGAGRGSRAARLVVDHADGASESPGESLSRARMIEHGFPLPVLQHELRDARGFVGRVDFWWPGARVVGEFDGRGKYGLEARTAADELWREKQREDRIRAVVDGVARWTWEDAWRGGPMAEALRRAGVR
ncbi:CTP synthase OS=Cellulomonas persica OX=76861 GN=CPE01_30040 PE=4 SV=1 [Cellulomonas persica]|uniref:CTP synthase n=2 Tax=Cellulomonas persica TaxID=76861 RepID=A0A510V0G9_9CELL|nr:hypothetical protein CPE01_30040 [Cellulomonas persica]